MGRPPYMASDSSISKEEPAALAKADPQDDIPAAADPEIVQSDAAALETESASAAAIPVAPEIPAAVALDAAAQPAAAQPAAALPPAIEWQAEEPPVAAQPPELEELSSSDSETFVNLGPRSAPQRPFAAADESAAIIPAVRPTRPTSLLPPSLTAVRPEVTHILSE
ncbi:predicted GPI-anchored protein 58 [Andrographis paniculata]|uniref:predicted GPI-anchored protein 58 n=1 Tax=Andrographis paniculata TaxID=175694 RepID=UPI0021E6F6C3|nr:predicted GPI-anchored protein 58 [Andrographis paniculata]